MRSLVDCLRCLRVRLLPVRLRGSGPASGATRQRFRPSLERLGELVLPSVVMASNASMADTCAEHDGVNVPLAVVRANEQLNSFSITATHTTTNYSVDNGAANFANCPPGLPGFPFANPGTFPVYDDGVTVVKAVRESEFDLPTGMTVISGTVSIPDIHYIQVYRRIAGTSEYPQVFVYYADGYARLKPQPPLGKTDTFFGSSVLIGPAAVSDRPAVDVNSIRFDPTTASFTVIYQSGESAILRLADVSRTQTRVDVSVGYLTTPTIPFATFRSMLVTDGNSDVDHATRATPSGAAQDFPILSFPAGQVTGVFFHREVLSTHNTSSPDYRIDNFQVSKPNAVFVVGADAGSDSRVQVVQAATHAQKLSVSAFPGFGGGVRAAAGDINGDGVPDIVAGAGNGGHSHVKVFDGVTGAQLWSFLAFPGFNGPVSVAAGDINGDGRADVIVGAPANGHVKVFDAATGALLRSFLVFEGFTGSVTVGAGDLDGDGIAELIVGAAVNGHVKAYDGKTNALVQSYFAYVGYPGAIFVAGGDVDGDGRAEIITGAGTSATHVKAFDGVTGALKESFIAYPGTASGVRVGATDVNDDGIDDILTTPNGPVPLVKYFAGPQFVEVASFFPPNAVQGVGLSIAGA